MSREKATRYRITFAKTDHMRYTSHLDLVRTWERTMRRAGLPLLYSGGFHPRARFSLAAALPLGFTGDAEIGDLYLTERLAPAELVDRLRLAAPPGLVVHDAGEVPSLGPAVQELLERAEYVIEIAASTGTPLEDRVEALLAAETLPRERRGKAYDLRPLVESLDVERSSRAGRLRAVLTARPGATGRPDELLTALGLDPSDASITRTRLVLSTERPMAGRS